MPDTTIYFHVSSVLNRKSIAKHGLWSVDGVNEGLLTYNGHGFVYLPGRVPAARVRITRSDIPASQ